MKFQGPKKNTIGPIAIWKIHVQIDVVSVFCLQMDNFVTIVTILLINWTEYKDGKKHRLYDRL